MQENKLLYQADLMDHYKYPKNRGKLENSNFSSGILNPSCGDRVSFSAIINDNKILDIKFEGSGCVISQATASILSERIKDKDLNYINNLTVQDILDFIKIDLGPSRLRCALISLEAMQEGLKNFNQ